MKAVAKKKITLIKNAECVETANEIGVMLTAAK